MEEQAISKVKNKSTHTVHEIEHADSELYKVGIYTTAAFAAMIGAWGLVCLSSATMRNAGPIELVKTLFQTITGS